ncbi:MAG: hypothetical protein R3E90_04805 [Marinicella sp.]|nr:hypothetical protein [Xanthomonadales bacterium]
MSLLTLLLVMGFAQAGDVSCQVDMLKPKMNANFIEEDQKPATITVTEARIRLQARQETPQKETALSEQDEQTEKEEPAKKESGLGSMFDILLPSKLRNPVQK